MAHTRDDYVDDSRDGSKQMPKSAMSFDHHTLLGPDTIAEEEAQGGWLRKDRPEGAPPNRNFTPGNRGA